MKCIIKTNSKMNDNDVVRLLSTNHSRLNVLGLTLGLHVLKQQPKNILRSYYLFFSCKAINWKSYDAIDGRFLLRYTKYSLNAK